MAYLTNTFKKLMTVIGVGTPSSEQMGEMLQGVTILDLNGRVMTKDENGNLRLISEANHQVEHYSYISDPDDVDWKYACLEENAWGDTGIGFGNVNLAVELVGDVCNISLSFKVVGFSETFPNTSPLNFKIDIINLFAKALAPISSVRSWGRGSSFITFGGNGSTVPEVVSMALGTDGKMQFYQAMTRGFHGDGSPSSGWDRMYVTSTMQMIVNRSS